MQVSVTQIQRRQYTSKCAPSKPAIQVTQKIQLLSLVEAAGSIGQSAVHDDSSTKCSVATSNVAPSLWRTLSIKLWRKLSDHHRMGLDDAPSTSLPLCYTPPHNGGSVKAVSHGASIRPIENNLTSATPPFNLQIFLGIKPTAPQL